MKLEVQGAKCKKHDNSRGLGVIYPLVLNGYYKKGNIGNTGYSIFIVGYAMVTQTQMLLYE